MVFLLICGFTGLAQSRNNHWLLGLTDVNFSSNPPAATVVSQGSAAKYGIATISDSNGALLFYTDGITVWNKNHQIMQNGDMIDVDTNILSKSLQKVIIVPHPGNSNRYYIIRDKMQNTAGTGGNGSSWGYYVYSIVDFSSNSLGQIVPTNQEPGSTGVENLYTSVLMDAHSGYYSPLTFTADTTGSNYWVIIQRHHSLYSFKIDSQGLNTVPVESTFLPGQIYNLNANNNGSFIQRSMFRVLPILGTSKLYGLESSFEDSGDTDPGNHLSHFYSVDFDMATGHFSNYQNILLEYNGGISYNFELSPDLTKAYFVAYRPVNMPSGNDGQVMVKDLSNLNTPSRVLYEFASSTTASAKFYSIQKDKYGNMLVSGKSTDLNRNKYLHIINNPNSFSGSSVKINNLYLNGNTIGELPQLFPKVECIESLYLNTTETTNKTYKVSNIISTNTNYAVNNGVTVALKAENAIFLEPNTDIKDGAILYAEIEVCSNSSTDRVNMYSEDDSSSEMMLDNSFIMYPNPTDDITTFVLSDDVIENISVFSLDGRQIFTKNIQQKEFELDVKDYPKGIYIVNIETVKGENLTKKLIKN
ncbi:T9SS type A sorting domain-containing protein [Flavobacterium sp. AG291]|uniref:T9SS type A sorting domain-containing protein n=1 Tax=Flavobacterium sp. AG291 TaxID=2184000 RepID=UPI000E2A7D76|nr:T9SS type A sorting domain-containing protein [Flavobacterium sp. AG291]RDI05826.1 putative secreted protein (Por secretion system target) [Flavobacterium sp. AG291]